MLSARIMSIAAEDEVRENTAAVANIAAGSTCLERSHLRVRIDESRTILVEYELIVGAVRKTLPKCRTKKEINSWLRDEDVYNRECKNKSSGECSWKRHSPTTFSSWMLSSKAGYLHILHVELTCFYDK